MQEATRAVFDVWPEVRKKCMLTTESFMCKQQGEATEEVRQMSEELKEQMEAWNYS